MATSTNLESTISNPSTSSAPESRARTSRSRASASDSRASAQASFISLRESLRSFDPLGFSSRMFPDFSVLTTAETLQKSSAFLWSSAGMGFAGASSTASFSESPSAADVCTLSGVLESRVDRRFYLSPKSARGILRRAARRGKELPPRLQAALESLAAATSPAPCGNATVRTDGAPDCGATGATTSSPSQTLLWPEDEKPDRTAPSTGRTSSPEPSRTPGTDGGTTAPSRPPSELPREADRSRPTSSPCDLAQTITAGGYYDYNDEKKPTHLVPMESPSPCGMSGDGATTDGCSPSSHTPSIGQRDRASHRLSLGSATMVRRLTPTECETLQGFPKGWTIPQEWTPRDTKRSGTQ